MPGTRPEDKVRKRAFSQHLNNLLLKAGLQQKVLVQRVNTDPLWKEPGAPKLGGNGSQSFLWKATNGESIPTPFNVRVLVHVIKEWLQSEELEQFIRGLEDVTGKSIEKPMISNDEIEMLYDLAGYVRPAVSEEAMEKLQKITEELPAVIEMSPLVLIENIEKELARIKEQKAKLKASLLKDPD